jgi:outer membrane protein assembly factor BamD
MRTACASGTGRARVVAAIAAIALLGGCASHKAREEAQNDPAKLYELGRKALDSGYYDTAIKDYQDLASKFPFGDLAQQGQLDMAYAQYMANQPEAAVATADQFIKTYPRHPNVDYAYYVRGLATFAETRGALDDLLGIDPAQRDPRPALESFQYFAELIKRFPDSRYAADARQRMVYLKNYLARHEIYVADYYLRRGAYVAAANRAQTVVENYPQTRSVPRALRIMIEAYEKLGLKEAAADARRVLEANERKTSGS